ncbi:hypothetical protein FISHEDRAFT_62378 [Fistulina hepatica ATCC 64428]|nr:hypothetical protein FISHEDRAFT_62378 [Fistulina hepatica ATCC 64428]
MNGKFPDSELAEALHAKGRDTTHRRHNNPWCSIDELRDVVSRTNGYFVRGYSLYLGWNNMRHIIEAGLQQARLSCHRMSMHEDASTIGRSSCRTWRSGNES